MNPFMFVVPNLQVYTPVCIRFRCTKFFLKSFPVTLGVPTLSSVPPCCHCNCGRFAGKREDRNVKWFGVWRPNMSSSGQLRNCHPFG